MNITQAKKLSPVRIVYKSLGNCDGEYHTNGKFIVVDKTTKSISDQIITLLHEIGHAIHHANDCQCMQNRDDHTLAEYHAYKYVMKHIGNNKKLISLFVAEINRALKFNNGEHHRAAKQITGLKRWKTYLL